MSKAKHLAVSGLQRLADARNSALIHKCEHGHPLCAMTFNGPCAEEAAELYSLQKQMNPSSQDEKPHPITRSATPNTNTPQLTLF